MRRLVYPALITALAALGACSTERAAETDPYAGLSEAVRDWRLALVDSPACPAPAPEAGVEGPGAREGCRSFAETCKVEAPLTEAERASGAQVKALTGLRWEAWDPVASEFRNASAAAYFTRAGETWTRSDAPPVNLSTCQPFAAG
ncbi:MAG: hypothetical protein Q8R71_06725 [Phenylobacterium sp.]|nr:hypothetical protein [Phenylobacterium sp.]